MVKPRFDISILIPILIGCFSIAGLCIVLVFGQFNNSRSIVQANDTETPSDFIYLGTEPGIFAPTLIKTEIPAPTEAPAMTEVPRPAQFTATPFKGSTNTSISIDLATDTPTPTPTPVNTSTPGASIYDDTDFRLVYSGNWSPIQSTGAYQDTLHVSYAIGDAVSFSFIGQQVEFSYLSGPSLGTVTVTLDSLGFNLDQSNSVTQTQNWLSGTLVQGTHTVVITHSEGGSVNIDSITVPYVPPSTITSTP